MTSHVHGLSSEEPGKMKQILHKCITPFKSLTGSNTKASPIYKLSSPSSRVKYQHVVTMPPTSSSSDRPTIPKDKNIFDSCGNCGFRSYYPIRTLIGLAIAQIFCGLIVIALQITSMEEEAALHEVASGIWGGCVVVITGVIGLIAAKKEMNWNLIVTFRLMSIASILFCLGPLITAILDMLVTCWPQLLPDFVKWFIPMTCTMATGIDGSMIFITLVESIIGSISAKITCCCCIPCCCC